MSVWKAVFCLVITLYLVTVLIPSTAVAQQPKDPNEKPEQFPAGAHREDTFYFCTACHGFKIVAAQGMNREQWDETLTWMQDKHNLPKTDGHDRAQLLDYLSGAFPPKPSPRGWKSPLER